LTRQAIGFLLAELFGGTRGGLERECGVEVLRRIQPHPDRDGDVRGMAPRILAGTWPGEETREVLSGQALTDPESDVRGAAFHFLGEMSSDLGKLLTTLNLDGQRPYRDPLEPILQEHIERAARLVGIPQVDIPGEVASLSEFVGWDITKGAKKGKAK
jgi:hypothetical protein